MIQFEITVNENGTIKLTQRGNSISRTLSIGLGNVGGILAAEGNNTYLILFKERATSQQ